MFHGKGNDARVVIGNVLRRVGDPADQMRQPRRLPYVLRNRRALNKTGFVAVNLTQNLQLFSLLEGDVAVRKITQESSNAVIASPKAKKMEIILREDFDPDTDFYYRHQFKIYHDSYLIWDRDTWDAVLSTCTVFRIEVDGRYAGDVIIEDMGRGAKSIIDFSILPEYQGRGIGRAVVENVKEMDGRLTAVTRKGTLDFFLKCGFVVKKLIRNYYHRGVDGYYIVAGGKRQK